ncbi:MAG: DUF4040 domain-containing protein [Proteobacteria bacterium]|nr:DUF4040 domain-containing protein [Pseudomonadota bacterium]MBU1686923.1 DUF4040 domain-containing protein [Pseudomonadota bacterium]
MILILFDFVLIITLPLLGWAVLATEDIFKAVVLFVSFGLLMSLAWVRLNAPDVALAEAAIGAGVTGALFLSALNKLERSVKHERRINRDEEKEAINEREI